MAGPVSGKSIGSNSTGRISPIAPPRVPNINDYLAGDTAYKQQMDASSKAAADYLAQMTGQQNNYNTEYTRNLSDLGTQEKLDGVDHTNDFAARGMMQSGVYVKDRADLANNYNKREATLADGKSEFMGNLGFAKTNFDSQQRLNTTRYRNEAIQRRAAKYNL